MLEEGKGSTFPTCSFILVINANEPSLINRRSSFEDQDSLASGEREGLSRSSESVSSLIQFVLSQLEPLFYLLLVMTHVRLILRSLVFHFVAVDSIDYVGGITNDEETNPDEITFLAQTLER